MDPKIKTNNHKTTSDPELEEFAREAQAGRIKLEKAKKEFVWYLMDQIIDELVEKQDMIETTFRDCLVGYTLDQLELNNLLKEKAFIPMNEITIKIKPPRKYVREPYAQFKTHPAWKVLDQTIEDLVENQDLVETTVRKCIIGYIMKRLTEHDLLK